MNTYEIATAAFIGGISGGMVRVAGQVLTRNKLLCGCNHSMGFHGGKDGTCQHAAKHNDSVLCGCQAYDGPPSPHGDTSRER